MSAGEVAEARRRAELTRARLSQHVAALKDRTRPAVLIADARDQAVTVVQSRPAIAAGAVAALVAIAAIPQVRRAGAALARFGWRNRKAIGLLMRVRLGGGAAANGKKDRTR